MNIQENISLKKLNTFGIDATAKYFAVCSSSEEFEEILNLQLPTSNLLILGGGSNILLTKNFDGLVLKNDIKGVKKINEEDTHVYVKAGAGENWHELVLHCIHNNWAGMENLSLIPGNAGASPMQNIGAYGVELKDVFHELEAYHIYEKKAIKFSLKDCGFGYRESVFKKKYRDQFVILNVTYKLSKHPRFNTSYGAIEQELERMGIKDLSISSISNAVINIRKSKLPNPEEIGNAGSFFKNPTIPADKFVLLQSEYPEIVGHKTADGQIKLAAGWLIEKCGWKGYRNGDAGCHSKQALVLVNYKNATGAEIFQLSEKIIESVSEKFGVELEREVNII